MNRYYMNEAEITGNIVSKGTSPNPSEYQDLIDDYLAGGGMIHRIDEGVTGKEAFDITESKYADPRDDVNYKPKGGYSLFDHIQDMKLLDKEFSMFGEGRDDH
jgi:hypothetical protein